MDREPGVLGGHKEWTWQPTSVDTVALKVASEAFVNRDVELAESVLQVKELGSCLLPLREPISFVPQTTE